MDGTGRDYPAGDLRVSDAERDRALGELSQAFQDGRITAGELDQRSGAALAARTGDELTAVLADLPISGRPGPGISLDDRLAARASALQWARRVVALRAAVGASVAGALAFGTVAVGSAVVQSQEPSAGEREALRDMLARHGMPVPRGPLPAPSFDWGSIVGPGVVAVVFIVLAIYFRARLVRARNA